MSLIPFIKILSNHGNPKRLRGAFWAFQFRRPCTSWPPPVVIFLEVIAQKHEPNFFQKILSNHGEPKGLRGVFWAFQFRRPCTSWPPPVVIFLEVIAQKHESNPFGFELGLLAKASYQGHASDRTVWERTKGQGFLYIWTDQLKTHFWI